MTCSPSRCSKPATTELSTPPDIATAIVPFDVETSGIRRCPLSQMPHTLDDRLDQQIDLFNGVRPADGKSDARSRLLLCQSDCAQYVRRLSRAAGACRSARHREAPEVERDQEWLGVDSVEANIRCVGSPRRACAVHVRIGNAIEDPALQPIPQSSFLRGFRHTGIDNPSRCPAHPDSARNIFRPCAAAPLMLTAE